MESTKCANFRPRKRDIVILCTPFSPGLLRLPSISSLQVLNAMLASGCEPNDVTWTAAIDAFGRVGNWRAAEACFARQLDRRRLLDAVSCSDARSLHKRDPLCPSDLSFLQEGAVIRSKRNPPFLQKGAVSRFVPLFQGPLEGMPCQKGRNPTFLGDLSSSVTAVFLCFSATAVLPLEGKLDNFTQLIQNSELGTLCTVNVLDNSFLFLALSCLCTLPERSVRSSICAASPTLSVPSYFPQVNSFSKGCILVELDNGEICCRNYRMGSWNKSTERKHICFGIMASGYAGPLWPSRLRFWQSDQFMKIMWLRISRKKKGNAGLSFRSRQHAFSNALAR